MSRKSRKLTSPSVYWGAEVPMRVIRRFARQVAERFEPDRIMLFGSHAYGVPHADSDVDILVVMPARNQHDQAARIRGAVEAPFPMDLIVRTPRKLAWLLAERESFHTEIMTKGKVSMKKATRATPIRQPLREKVMTLHGQIENGVVVLDPGVNLPEGTRVEVVPVARQAGDPLAVIAAMESEPRLSSEDIDELRRAIESAKRPAAALDPFNQDTAD